MLDLCRQTLYRMEKGEEIGFIRIRGRTLVPVSALERIAGSSAHHCVGDLKKRRPKKIQLFLVLTQ